MAYRSMIVQENAHVYGRGRFPCYNGLAPFFSLGCSDRGRPPVIDRGSFRLYNPYRPQRLEHHVTPQDVLSRPVEGKRKTPGSFDRGFFRCIISSPNQQRQESATEGGPKPRGPPFVRLHGLDYAAKGDDRANHREADSALQGFWKAAESVSYGIDEGIQESNHVPLLSFRHGRVEVD